MAIFSQLLVLLVLTRIFGEAAERLGQPASVGELASGIFLAAVAGWFAQDLPILSHLAANEILDYVADLGIFLLVLLAGVELEPGEIRRHSVGAFAVALGGVVVPLLGGFGLAWLALPESGLKQGQALLVGVAMSITAIPATIKVLKELNLLHTRIGETVVAAAVIDDVLGLILLAILLAVIQTGHDPDIAALAILLGKVALFFAVTVALGVHVYPRVRRGLKVLQAAAMEFSTLVAVALAYGLLAEALGMHWVLGAFMAGLYFEKSRVGLRAYNEMKMVLTAITGGFLGPLFFASIGLRVDLDAVMGIPVFLTLLVAFAFAGKIVGAGLPALAIGMGRREALAVGVSMSARGVMEIVVIGIAYDAGLFALGGQTEPVVVHLYSALILMAALTTMLTPIVLKQVLRGGRR